MLKTLKEDSELGHVPLKYSLPCDSRSQTHRFRVENPDTHSFLQKVDGVEHDLDRYLSQAERHLGKTVRVVHHQTEQMRRKVFGQMLTGINQSVEECRLHAQQTRKQGSKKRASDMTAAECQKFAQTQVDLLQMQTDYNEFLRRVMKKSSLRVDPQQEIVDQEARSLMTCRSRMDSIDLQFTGPCPRVGVSDEDVKREVCDLIDSF